jgi:hypothetical protein
MRRALVLLIVACVPFVSAGAAGAAHPRHHHNRGVFPVKSHPYGKSYGQWSARWWNWAAGTPAAISPLTDPTGERCGFNQHGPVFFLAGTTGGAAVTRSCTIPEHKAILVPILNAACQEGHDGDTEAALRTNCAESFIDLVTSLEADVDGRPVRGLFHYRIMSPLFTLTVVADNPFGDAAFNVGTYPGVTDGYWILLKPLKEGSHTIHFRGEIASFKPPFVTEATYHLTIVDEHHHG